MKCIICEKIKLRREFPADLLSDDCKEHPATCCLRCVKNLVPESKTCPYPGCGATVVLDGKQMAWCDLRLEQQFPDVDSSALEAQLSQAPSSGSSKKTLTVTVLNGDSKPFYFEKSTTVHALKKSIMDHWKYPVNKQKLVYNGTVLDVETEDYKLRTLGEYGVPDKATIHLIILLLAIPERLNDVIFDLYWGYPSRGRDYLDATCLAYSNTLFKEVIDYSNTRNFNSSIVHSGDVMNDHTRQGHHTIKVQLKMVPDNVTHLIFTLSAWNSPTIAYFKNPSLKFFDAKNPNTPLCKTTFTHAMQSEAVVMCSVSRTQSGGWAIFESGVLSAGCAKNYRQLQQTISRLIKENKV